MRRTERLGAQLSVLRKPANNQRPCRDSACGQRNLWENTFNRLTIWRNQRPGAVTCWHIVCTKSAAEAYMRRATRVALACAMLGLVSAGTAWAQKTPATSFDQLAGVLNIGDKVYLTDSAGRDYEGTVSERPESAIKIVGAGEAREFKPSDVSAIRRFEPDSKKNGAFIGMGIGAALGAAIGAFAAEESNSDSTAATSVVGALAYGALGALIGTGLDALSPGKRVLVYRSEPARAVRLLVVPVVLPKRQAVVARISF
jgi:hypothetical protein